MTGSFLLSSCSVLFLPIIKFRRVGTRGAGGLQPPLALKQGGSAPLKIDLVNHIQYAYSHSLLQSRLAMTVYTAIKAQ